MDSIYLQIKYNDFMSLMSIDVFALKSNNFNKKQNLADFKICNGRVAYILVILY